MTQPVNPKTLLVNHVKMVKTADVAESVVTVILLVNHVTTTSLMQSKKWEQLKYLPILLFDATLAEDAVAEVMTMMSHQNHLVMTLPENQKTSLVNHVQMVKTADVAESVVTVILLVNHVTTTRLMQSKKWKQLKHLPILLFDATLAEDAVVELMTRLSHQNHLVMTLPENQKTSLVNHVQMVKTADVAENDEGMTQTVNPKTATRLTLPKKWKQL